MELHYGGAMLQLFRLFADRLGGLHDRGAVSAAPMADGDRARHGALL
jgi:hypothetical protein